MTNKEVAYEFVCGRVAQGSNLTSSGNRIFSYNTCIGQRTDNGTIYVNCTKYSPTTSRHQSYLKGALMGMEYKRVYNAPEGVYDLSMYYVSPTK